MNKMNLFPFFSMSCVICTVLTPPPAVAFPAEDAGHTLLQTAFEARLVTTVAAAAETQNEDQPLPESQDTAPHESIAAPGEAQSLSESQDPMAAEGLREVPLSQERAVLTILGGALIIGVGAGLLNVSAVPDLVAIPLIAAGAGVTVFGIYEGVTAEYSSVAKPQKAMAFSVTVAF